MAATSYYSDYSSDESSDWSESPRRKRKMAPRKTKPNSLSRNTSANKGGAVRKAKKPGRKPLENFDELPSDPKLKRKVQNRAAQRAFRERKEQFVIELQEQLKELETAKEKREKELQKDIAKLKQENEKLKQEVDKLKKFPPDADKSHPTPMISPPITDDQIDSSPEQTVNCYKSNSSDLSDYQGSTPMTGSVSPMSVQYPFSSSPPIFNYSVPELDFSSSGVTFSNDPLQSLFGNTEIDLFGNATNNNTTIVPQELDPFFAVQMQALTEDHLFSEEEAIKPAKKKIINVLNLARGANRTVSQLIDDFKLAFPEGYMDQLCNGLRKIVNSDKNHILTDEEVDLYIECIKRNNN